MNSIGLVLEEIARSVRRVRRGRWRLLYLAAMLSLGLGCTVGIYDVASGLLLRPLACPHPDRVAVSANFYTQSLLFSYNLPNPHLSSIFVRAAEYEFLDANLVSSTADPRRIQVAMVSPQFFLVLESPVFIGKDFSESNVPATLPAKNSLPVVISYPLWRSYFGGDRSLLGRSIELDMQPYHFRVAGVAAPEFSFPVGVDAWVPTHLVSSSMIQTAGMPAESGGVIGLLKPGVTIGDARAAMGAWPKERLFDRGAAPDVQLTSLREFRAGEIYPLTIKLWFATVALLILIVIAVATTFKAEIDLRHEEFLTRSTLGATVSGLFYALCIESGLVVLVAVFASFPVRWYLLRVTRLYLQLPDGFDPGFRLADLAMIAGVAAVVLAASMLVFRVKLRRLPPFVSDSARRPHSPVPGGTRLPGRRFPLQIVPSAMLVILAILFAREAYRDLHIDSGVNTGSTFVSEIRLPDDSGKLLSRTGNSQMTSEEAGLAHLASIRLFRSIKNAQIGEILELVAKSPGVVHAGVLSVAPYRNFSPMGFEIQTSSTPKIPPNAPVLRPVALRSITPDALSALGVRIVHGRAFTGKGAEDENCVLVNQALAERIGQGADPIGRYLGVVSLPPGRIIGVASNVREEDLRSEVWPTLYLPFSQYAVADVDIVVRAASAVAGWDIQNRIRHAVRTVAPGATTARFQQLEEMVMSASTLPRYTAYFLGALALLAVMLAAGCASLITASELFRRRTEIGIRMALGAPKRRIVGMFVYSSLALNVIAAGLGAILAWCFASLLGHILLYRASLLDVSSYAVGVAGLIGAVAAVQAICLTRMIGNSPRDLM